jgi:putative heme-binding domain-containing protein
LETPHIRIAFRLCSLVFAASFLFGQHSYTPSDVQDGGQLFRANCVGCHGVNGDLVPGIDLGHGKFRHGSTDDELINIIRTGIAGTSMPPGNYTEFQAGTIVAYLRSMAATGRGSGLTGDAARGETLFEGKGGCVACHRAGSVGSRSGPDLNGIGALRRPASLEQSILQPDAEVLPQNRYYRVVTSDGTTVSGRLLNRDTFSVQLIDSNERIRSFMISSLREHGFVEKSPMPSYANKLTAQEVADLVSYLGALKGIANK